MNRAWGQALEEELAQVLYGGPPGPALAGTALEGDREAVAAVRRMVAERRYRGTGGLRAWYPKTLAAWRALHPGDPQLEELVAQFCCSSACGRWREHGDGVSLEEALFGFFEARGVGEASVREDELLGAVVRALAVTPRARFTWPRGLTATERGCVAVSAAGVLHAAVDGAYLTGPVTPMVAQLLSGTAPSQVAAQHAVPIEALGALEAELRRRGLLDPAKALASPQAPPRGG